MSAAVKPERANPLAAFDLDEFKPEPAKAAKPKPEPATIRAMSEAQGFPSREAAPKAPPKPQQGRVEQRRHRTGRNHQLTLKVTPECAARFERLANTVEKRTLVYGELLDLLMDTYEAAQKP